jgi:predicted glycoside hydrolase/deacetylase ChbG (UPF0249 family)
VSAVRSLIVNADDFGLSAGVNEGVIEGSERGIVTSASLMVGQPAAAEAAAYARTHSKLAVGLHLDLGEWAFRAGEWEPLYEVVPLDQPAAVAAEVARQLSLFRQLVGSDPTHVDSHQHVHRSEPVRRAVAEGLGGLDVPLRHFDDEVRYCGRFYGQTDDGTPVANAISTDALAAILVELPAGVTELACHPARGRDLHGMYVAERERELEVLCDRSIAELLSAESIRLVSFAELRAARS